MPNNAVAWLHDYRLFWQVRGRFYALAFDVGESDPRAARTIPDHDELLSLHPVLARGLWDRAMREVGNGLTREAAINLSALSSTARRAIAAASVEVLSLTPTESEPVLLLVLLEDDSLWGAPDFWDWVARERIAEGLENGGG